MWSSERLALAVHGIVVVGLGYGAATKKNQLVVDDNNDDDDDEDAFIFSLIVPFDLRLNLFHLLPQSRWKIIMYVTFWQTTTGSMLRSEYEYPLWLVNRIVGLLWLVPAAAAASSSNQKKSYFSFERDAHTRHAYNYILRVNDFRAISLLADWCMSYSPFTCPSVTPNLEPGVHRNAKLK